MLKTTNYLGDSLIESERVYINQGNLPLIELLSNNFKQVLDIGCGAGNNAVIIKSKYPESEIFGITYSTEESRLAQKHMTKCWVSDIEGQLPNDLEQQTFDVLLFSHVLEHLRNPAEIVARFSKLLRNGGQVLIAVPNILYWRMRVQFLMGNFEYKSAGVLDNTHLRFYTYFTADQYLLSKSPDLEINLKTAHGYVPLWWLRRRIFPQRWIKCIDQWGCCHWPNLFGAQVLIRAEKR